MSSRKIIVATAVTMLAAVACGNASFSGGGGGTKKSEQGGAGPNGNPNGSYPGGTNPNGTNPNGSYPGGTNPNGSYPGGTNPNGSYPGGTNPNGSYPGGANPNGSYPGGANPNGSYPGGTNPNGSYPGGTNPNSTNCNGAPCDPQIGPNDQVTQPTPNSVVFGHDQVFHIGDGKFDNTSCKRQVASLPLTGDAYFFRFEVLNDNTAVQVNVGSICGIDYGTNKFEIFSGKNLLQGRNIPLRILQFAGTSIVLNKGVYDVVLASGFGRDQGDPVGDFDDYVVGNVTIKGNNAVRPVKYGAFKQTP